MKLPKLRGIFAVALACVLALSTPPALGITVNAADSETVTVTVSGTYYATDYDAVLERLNEIRLEAYELGYVDSYVPLQWSSALEEAAIQRAAEADYYLGHTRPDGTSCFTIYSGISAENLAWNSNTDTISKAIELWYAEKSYYESGNTSSAGHYISIINPSYNYTGLAAFQIDGATWACTAQEFSSQSDLDSTELNYSASSASFEMDKYVIMSVSVTADSTSLEVGGTTDLTVTATSSLSSDGVSANGLSSIPLTDGFTITSSDTDVVTVDTLTATAVGAGSATITVVAGSDFSAEVTITVTESASTDDGSSSDTGSTTDTSTGSTDTSSSDTGSTTDTSTGSADTSSSDTGSTTDTSTGSSDTGSTTDTSTGSADTSSSDTGSTTDTSTGSSDTGSSSGASDEDSSSNDFQEYVTSIENEIVTAAQSEDPVVTIGKDSGMTALPNSVMQYLVQNSNVSLVFDFTYDGNEYSVTIPAGTAVDNDIAWYGPLYLIGKYGTDTTVAATGTANGTVVSLYTVQSGDTLSLIAADFDTTLSELIALNPQIVNPNRIYPGDIINIG